MIFYAVSHPIDTVAHPDIPPGWRWAVYVDNTDWTRTIGCLGAGWAAEEGQAGFVAMQAANACVRTLHYAGHNADEPTPILLDFDPIPAEVS